MTSVQPGVARGVVAVLNEAQDHIYIRAESGGDEELAESVARAIRTVEELRDAAHAVVADHTDYSARIRLRAALPAFHGSGPATCGGKVGCEGDDGLLRVHAESETCDVCATPAGGGDALPSAVAEALQRLIEDAVTRGPASADDARTLIEWRRRLASASPVAAGGGDAVEALRKVVAEALTKVENDRTLRVPEWQAWKLDAEAALARLASAPATGGGKDGWQAMTDEARSMMLRHLDNHTGDIYHALQSLIVRFGYRSTEPMIVPLDAATPAGGGDAPSFWFIEQPGNDGGWWAGGTRFDLTKDPNKAVRFPSRQAAEKFIAIFGAAWADCIATEHGWIDAREMEAVRREVQEARLASAPARVGWKPDFTKDEVNECFDLLKAKGPRLIPDEVIEEMRSHLLEAAAPAQEPLADHGSATQ